MSRHKEFDLSVQRWLVSGPQLEAALSGEEGQLLGILQPTCASDVQEIIQQCNRFPGIRLFAVSCGRNWGFGSRVPTQSNVYLVDLSKMRTIRHIDFQAGWVEVEPGVTQGMLDEALLKADRSHFFNVTGAGAETSLVGNALEKGIGYFGPRQDDILGLEVALPNGELLRTSTDDAFAGHSGLGPDIDGLFLQSNLGIVTSARLRLIRKPEVTGALIATLNAGQSVGLLIERLAEMKSERIFHSVPHVGNRQRAISTFAPHVPADRRQDLERSLSEWSAVIPVGGSLPMLKAIEALVTSRLESIAGVRLVHEAVPGDFIGQSLLSLAQGIPSNIALKGVSFSALGCVENVDNLDDGTAGLIHVVPACPPDHQSIAHLLKTIEAVADEFEFPPLPQTINVINSGMAVVVNSVPFRKDQPDRVSLAQNFARELLDRCVCQGFLPYRLGLQQPKSLHSNPARLRFLADLQKILDPNSIMASSKYATPATGDPGRSLPAVPIQHSPSVDELEAVS